MQPEPPPFLKLENTAWTDSILNGMSLDEKIGQLFMVAAYSNRGQSHTDEISRLIREQHIGGLIFMQGGPAREAILTNLYQSQARVPLLMSIDGEWGLAMRLDSTIQFPRQMTLGAVRDDSLVYYLGKEIAQQAKRIGLHVNFAPVVDVNNNPLNPVISTRSFGEDKELVARKGIMYMKGMQDQGILANAKHFPGHGDTDSDSHYTLPVIKQAKHRIDSLELYPFRRLINNGLGSMMVAHLYIPALDSTPNRASTLSPLIVDSLLKNEIGFKGLIFTDALNMKGVADYFEPGELEVQALLAGNDVLLFPENVPVAAAMIKETIEKGLFSEAELDKRVRKILLAKQWAGLDHLQPVSLHNLYNDLNNSHAELLRRRIIEKSLTLLKNEDDLLPLRRLDTLKVASVELDANGLTDFQSTLSLYGPVDHYQLSARGGAKQLPALIQQLKPYNLVVVNFSSSNLRPKQQFGLPAYATEFLNTLYKSGARVVVSIQANPYVIMHLQEAVNADAVAIAYENNEVSRSYTAQAIYGGVAYSGRLPVSLVQPFEAGTGTDTRKIRFRYSTPEDVNMNSAVLGKIDTVIAEAIKKEAFPGAQVMVVKSGTVVWNKSYGYHSYEHRRKVSNDDLYDIASITKITASVPVLMDLSARGMLDLDQTLGHYLPEARGTNKENLRLREILAHQAGLQSWIPFYLSTLSRGSYRPGIYSTERSEEYPVQVASDLFIRRGWNDTIMKRILESPVDLNKEYRYSDLGYYLLQKVVERVYEKPLDEIVQERFYRPLGMSTTTYRPLEKFPEHRLVPTEYDMAFRKQLVHGYVHDQGAAMLGGVAGHAGLFSNANDLAKIMQMFLNNGTYGGIDYLPDSVVYDYTRQQFCENENRRGAGFDRPSPEGGPVCVEASMLSFGHSGFTGTLAWSDPERNIVYIFLSNRVNPSAENNKLVTMNVRTRIQELIYQADIRTMAFNVLK